MSVDAYAAGAALTACARAALCAVTAPGAAHFGDAGMPPAAEWPALLRAAERHGVLPLVAATGLTLPDLPPAARAPLEAARHDALAADRVQVLVLADLLDAFAARGVPVMLLKGLALSEALAVDPATRIGRDIDLLVRRADRGAADEILVARGFVPFERDYFERWHFHVPYRHRSRAVGDSVELHWDVTDARSPVRFPVDGWWSEAREVRLRAGLILVPPELDELAYVALHATWNGGWRLKEIRDAVLLWQRTDDGRHAAALERAAAAGGLGFVVATLDVAHALWGGRPPAPGGPSPSALRRTLARGALAPRRLLSVADQGWWAQRRVAHWAMLPPGAGGLFFPPDVPDEPAPWHGPAAPRGARSVGSVLAALVQAAGRGIAGRQAGGRP